MFPTELKIIASEFVTPDTKRFITTKPNGFVFSPGQALLLSINLPEYKDIIRPYSITSINDQSYLEFYIKSYPDGELSHKVTSLNAGDSFIAHNDIQGVKFKGPGVFIAGGTGITAFISMIRALFLSQNTRGVGLLYSVHAPVDILLGNEFKNMLGNNFVPVFTKYKVIGFREKRMDKQFLVDSIGSFDQIFYVAGPPEFVQDISSYLLDLGASSENIVI